MINALLGSFGFVAAVFLGTILVGYKLPKRRYFVLRVIVICVALCLLRYGNDELAMAARNSLKFGFNVLFFWRATNCLLILVLSCASVCVCYKANIWSAFFCSAVGYCMQHLSRKVYELIPLFFSFSPNKYIETVLVFTITAIAYFLIWWFGLRKIKNMSVLDGNKGLILVVVFVAILTIYMNTFANTSTDSTKASIYMTLFSIMATSVTLIMEFIFLLKIVAEKELEVLKQLIHGEKEQYNTEKAVIEAINIKSHDLKHQLVGLSGMVPVEELAKLRDSVDVYDSLIKTGNKALDTVLTTKALVCENKGITFTCIANGELLSFMKESDIYSLFGNIVDNAIEATEKIGDKNKRLISMTMKTQKGFILLHEDNYFAEVPVFVDGMPQTTKSDKKYHGFGMKSIKLIVERNHGVLKIDVKDDLFLLDIILPMQ